MELGLDNDKTIPSKPPAPVLPQKPCIKQTVRKSLDLTDDYNSHSNLLGIGCESISSNVCSLFPQFHILDEN